MFDEQNRKGTGIEGIDGEDDKVRQAEWRNLMTEKTSDNFGQE